MGFDYRNFPRKLNLGCGFDIREGYLNVDLNDFHKPDLVADVQNLEMLPSSYYEEIIAQDLLEHLPRTATKAALFEWNRILMPEGLLILRVPDVLGLLKLFQKNKKNIEVQENLIQCLFGTQAYTGDFHFTSFTELLLNHYLRVSGFSIITITHKDEWLLDVTAKKNVTGFLEETEDFQDAQEFITQAYRNILKREPDEEGFHYYLSKITTGKMNRKDFLKALHNSEERQLLSPGNGKERMLNNSEPENSGATKRVPLIDQFLSQKILICTNCHSCNLVNTSTALICSDCSMSFRREENFVDFIGNYVHNATVPIQTEHNAEIVKKIIEKLDLDNDASTLDKIQKIVSDTSKKTGKAHLNAEISLLAERFDGANDVNRNDSSFMDKILEPHCERNKDVKIIFERDYIEKVLPGDAIIYRNVRIRNIGKTYLSSHNKHPFLLSYHWLDLNHNLILWDGERTVLPIDIPPLSSLTIPLRIKTPVQSGEYILQVCCVIENITWIHEPVLNIHVELTKNYQQKNWFNNTGNEYNYEKDHTIGRSILKEYIENNYKNHKMSIIEVGSAIHPQSTFIAENIDLVSIDISSVLCQLGSLYFQKHCSPEFNDRLAFFSTDAINLPFKENSFDGIVMFSTLHHFDNPVEYLNILKKFITPHGFIAIMCEPVGSVITESMLREMYRGINEQTFSLEEYAYMFESSGLLPVLGQVDCGSLKTILIQKPDSSEKL